MHAIRPPVVTRVSVRDDACHLGLTFPDVTDATRFGHDAAALLDQGVDLDLARSAATFWFTLPRDGLREG